MEQKIIINQIESFTQKSKFGSGKYYGYEKNKFLGIIRVTTNKKIVGYGETLVGVYSPKLLKINLSYIANFINKKSLNIALFQLNNFKKNKFFFDNGILKSIISGIEIAIFDILAQANNTNHALIMKNFFKYKQKIINKVNIYSSAGSIKSNLTDLRKDIDISKKLNIFIFKGRLALNKNISPKLSILQNEIDNYAVDLIANSFEKNNDLKKLDRLLKIIKSKKPIWIEEVLKTDYLFKFLKIKKYGLNFSYGENFNSLIDFINLLEIYKFKYINPDMSHLSIFDFKNLNNHLKNKNLKNKIIIHCWGGAINFIYSIYCAQLFREQVKLVEFPITKSNFMTEVYKNIFIENSLCVLNDKIKSFGDIIDINKLEKIQFSKLTFNFE